MRESPFLSFRANNRNTFRRFDIPAIIALGVKVRTGKIELMSCFRYDIGLLSFVKNSSGDKDNRYIIEYEDPSSEEITSYTERYNLASMLFGISIPLRSSSK